MEFLRQLDLNILVAIQEFCHNAIFDQLFPVITSLGNGGAIWIFLSIALLLSREHKHIGFLTLSALFLGAVVGNIALKNIIQRARPFTAIDGIELLISAPLDYSFPSGHTLSSFAAASIIAYKFPRFSIPILTLAVLIAFSRLYLFVHYPFDVLCGAVLGIVCAKVVLLINWQPNFRVLLRRKALN